MDETTGLLALSRLARLVEAICALRRAGHKVVLVTSGAVGVGMRRLGMTTKPKDMVQKQACSRLRLGARTRRGGPPPPTAARARAYAYARQAAAAVGQGRLMRVYDDLFSQLNQTIAQVLLTRSDLSEVPRRMPTAGGPRGMSGLLHSAHPRTCVCVFVRPRSRGAPRHGSAGTTSTAAKRSESSWRWTWSRS